MKTKARGNDRIENTKKYRIEIEIYNKIEKEETNKTKGYVKS